MNFFAILPGLVYFQIIDYFHKLLFIIIIIKHHFVIIIRIFID